MLPCTQPPALHGDGRESPAQQSASQAAWCCDDWWPTGPPGNNFKHSKIRRHYWSTRGRRQIQTGLSAACPPEVERRGNEQGDVNSDSDPVGRMKNIVLTKRSKQKYDNWRNSFFVHGSRRDGCSSQMGILTIHPNSIGRDVADAPKQGMWAGGVLAITLVPK